jgi:uncharacterized membrane protein
MRKLAVLLFGVVLFSPGSAAAATSEPPPVKGLWLITDYPSITARAGEATTLKLKLQNYNLPPQRVALTVDGVPEGWKVRFLGGGQPVGAAMPATNEAVNLQLRIEVPAEVDVPQGAPAANHTLRLKAEGESARTELPLQVALGSDVPASLSAKPKLPSLRGTVKSSFEYQLTVVNESGKDLLVRLAAEGPPNFQTSFSENFGSQEISSIPIEAGQNKDLRLKVQPPSDAAAGEYKIAAHIAAEGVEATTPLTLELTGQPKLKIAGKEGRLSGSAEAGTARAIALLVTNDGSAPAEQVELSASPPSEWKGEFEPKKIDRLGPGESREVQAMVTPSSKAIAGDYMTTFRASTKGDSTSADYRVTVTTSTIWGVVGIGIIAASLLVVVGAVMRFGRR